MVKEKIAKSAKNNISHHIENDSWIYWTFVIASAYDVFSNDELLQRFNNNNLEEVKHSIFYVFGPKNCVREFSFSLAFEHGWCKGSARYIFLHS
jgi:hypothetical protein